MLLYYSLTEPEILSLLIKDEAKRGREGVSDIIL